jgi:phage terminase large subunit
MSEAEFEIRPRKPFRPYLERDKRWACMVVHRRGGKTFGCIQDLLAKAFGTERPGPPLRFAYIAPTRDQAKDIAWGYLKTFLSPLPGVRINEADLLATLPNGATIRLYSGESYERMRGLYLDGAVIDEYADIDPAAWHSVIRPCLSDYNGWATFIGTPKGRNAFWRLWNDACGNPEWFTLMLKASDSGIIPEEELRDIRKGTPSHIYEQEYECSFAIGRPGAIYVRNLEKARAEKRISNDILWFKELPVYTSWDVGAPLNQKVWIWQMVGDRLNFLEALSGDEECKTPADWAARLKAKQYAYGSHFIPHDASTENGGLWQGALATAGLTGVAPVPRQLSVWDGINLANDAFPRIHFNEAGCEAGLDALDAYHSKEERDGVTIKDVPVHDWSSHFADAFSLSHQAINRGMVIDRSAIPRKAVSGERPKVMAGFRGGFSRVRR